MFFSPKHFIITVMQLSNLLHGFFYCHPSLIIINFFFICVCMCVWMDICVCGKMLLSMCVQGEQKRDIRCIPLFFANYYFWGMFFLWTWDSQFSWLLWKSSSPGDQPVVDPLSFSSLLREVQNPNSSLNDYVAKGFLICQAISTDP